MRKVFLVGVTAAAVLAPSMPSSAAPDRSVSLSHKERAVTWGGDFGASPYAGVPAAYEPLRCTELMNACDYTLVHLTEKGAISVEVHGQSDVGYPPLLTVSLYTSDAQGTLGAPVPVTRRPETPNERLQTGRLAAGHYLVEVEWTQGAGSYYALAQLIR